MDDWKSYWKERLDLINQHINLDCDPENHDYCWISKGIIVADDATGEKLAFVKENLRTNELAKVGKVNEIMVNKPFKDFDDCWDTLLPAARTAKHGLLVINVNSIDLFNYCWCVKQLAKQEDPALEIDCYVLLVLNGRSWNEVKAYASKQNKGEFDAMLQFYRPVIFETH